MIGQDNHGIQKDNGSNTIDESAALINSNLLILVKDAQADVQTLEKNVIDRARSEVHNAVKMVEDRIHDAILAATDSLVIPKVELPI